MSPRRRSFSFILIFISLNKGPALCQTVGPGIPQSSVPLPQESVPFGSSKSQLLNTLLTIASANGVLPSVLPAIQRIFPESQNIVTNEGITQPLPPQEVLNGRPCQQCFTPNLSFNPNSLPPSQLNLGIINPYPAAPNCFVNEGILADETNGRSCQQCFTPNLVLTNPSPYQITQANFMVPNPPVISPSYAISPPTASPYPITSFLPSPPSFSPPQAPPTIPTIPITDQNYNWVGPVPIIGLSEPQTLKQGDIYPLNCNLQPEIIQPQFNLQIPQMVQPASSITRPPALPVPSNSIPLQSIRSWPCLPEPNAIPISSSIEIPVTNVGTADTATDCGQQFPLPISLQINMPAPVMPEPIIAVISAATPSPDYSSSFIPSMMPPMHVVEKSRSRWKRWLPIILLALLDGGCGNNCGGGCSGCQCGSNIPIPYPIPIPTSNPIVMGCQLSDN